jgi:DNA-binding FrmR family transcriptional regulator
MIPEAKKEVLDRLNKANGHLEGILRMVEDEKPEVEILRQILAVHGALEKTTVLVMEGMLEDFMDSPKSKRTELLAQLREGLRDLT